jgi:2C-methyl-D-erythritol 2,4-cyclodiphosphate synthase
MTKILAEAETQGSAQKYAAQKAKKAAQVKMKGDLQQASHDFMQAHFEYGGTSVQAIAAQKKLEDMKAAANSVLATYSDVDAAVINGKNNWDATIKQFKDTAGSKVKAAIFAYEHAVLSNAPATKIAELKLQMEHAKKTEEKFFPKAEMDGLHAEQLNAAKGQVAIDKQMAKLGANLKTKLADMDSTSGVSQGGGWEYPHKNGGSSLKDEAFRGIQSKQRQLLTEPEKARLKAHTSNAFTDINRAMGA